MSLRGNTAPPDGCPRERSTAPAGCAAESRMTILRSGISGRPWMPSSSCWKPSNFSHEKTLPNRGWQTPAAPGQEAFLTPYLTTVRTGTRGNSGFKSVKKYSIPSRKRRKALQINTKNLVQPFQSISRPSMRTKAQPHNPLGHYQKREPVRQSRWSKNGLDHMFDHSYNHFISGCSAVGSAPALGAGCREFKSPHSDQNSAKSFDFAEFFFIFIAK